jgi:hypothetical protein
VRKLKNQTANRYRSVPTPLLVPFLCLSALPLAAQNSMVFANPVVFPGLRQQGFVIQTSVSQTATTSTVTYSVTPPPNYLYNGDTMIGILNLQLLLPAGSQIPIQFTISYTGWANVIGNSGSSILAGGYSYGPSPQIQNIIAKPGAGMLSFFLSGSSPLNPQPAPPSSISVTANIGNPQGGRKAYLNDYTGGGKTNYALWRPSEGNWYIYPVTAPVVIAQWGLPGDTPVPGDYDGDGITDYAVWRPSEGNWYVILSSTGQLVVTPWGLPGDVPILAGDYDGDGKTDYAVWRPSEGNWYVRLSGTGAEVITQFGLPGDIPLTGNFDGDAKTDYVVWRPSEASWYVYSSSTGTITATQWGFPGDIPVPGDFDGDGKTDYAVWRPSEANWYVHLSSTGGEVVTQWGYPTDIPLSGDFDGDGKTDYAVWRPSEGNWYIVYSSTGMVVVQQWGLAGDIPDGQTVRSVTTP